MGEPSFTDASNSWTRFGWLMGGVWLVFLAYPASALVRSTAGPGAIAVGWLGLVMFAAAYLIGFIVGMRVKYGKEDGVTQFLFGAAILSAVITIPAIGWGATSFTPFVMSYASYLLSRPVHWAATALGPTLIVLDVLTAEARGEAPPWPLLGIVGMIATVNTINSWLIRRSAAADELRVELATSEGREAVARDVHDLLGHSLTVIKLKAELAAKLIDHDPASARTELDEIVRLTSEAIAGVRGTVTGVRGEGLDEQLLATENALATAGVALEVHGRASALSPAQSITAAWILRETPTNVLRHARASLVSVAFAPGTLIVTDDGTGAVHAREGNGIRGMRERAAAAGAELSIGSGAAGGTEVSLTW